MTPFRGEVWFWDLGMLEKVRPARVVSIAYRDRVRALITLVPHTKSKSEPHLAAVDSRGTRIRGIEVGIPHEP